MTRDDVIRMAREAGIDEPQSDWMYWAAMERFAALVEEAATAAANARANTSWWRMCKKMVAAEREACAKVCEEAHWSLCDRDEYAAAIRARSAK